MLTALGVALLGGGLYALFMTTFPARSTDEVRRLDEADQRNRRELGVFGRSQSKYLWAAKFTYRHPVAARVPGVLLVIVGIGLTVLGLSAS